jgi:hypothetical protein
MLAWLKAVGRYLKDRAFESSTWKDVGLAVAAGALLPAPWSYWAFGTTLASSLLKDWRLELPK